MKTKLCARCGSEFRRHPRYSRAQWERATFCSNTCRGLTLRKQRRLCACGCGGQVAKPSSVYRPGHNPQPERRKHLQVATIRGKTRWFVTDREGNRVVFARVVMAGHLGRELLPDEVVHHINGDSSDDRIENLRLFANHSEHMRDEWTRWRAAT